MKKHRNCKKYHDHKKIVGGIVAAALAFTMVVGSQLGAVNPAQLATDMASDCSMAGGSWSASTNFCQMPSDSGTYTPPTNITCPDGSMVPNGTACPTTGGTGGTYYPPSNTSGTIWCNSLNRQATTTECNAADTANTGGTYWCPVLNMQATPAACAAAGTSGTTYPSTSGTNCGAGYWWNGTSCQLNSAQPACGSGQWWDSMTNTCKSSTTTTSCGSGQWWDPSTGSCKSSTTYSSPTGGAGSSYVTQPTCQSAAYFWSYSTNKCYTTQAEKTAAETAMSTANTYPTACPSGQWWNSMTNTCTSSTTNTYSGSTSGQYKTQATCTAAALFWGTKSNWCFNTQAEKTAGETAAGSTMTSGQNWSTTDNPALYKNDPAGCKAKGFYYDTGINDCFPSKESVSPTNTGTMDYDMYSNPTDSSKYMPPAVPFCAPPSYYDFMRQSCQTPMNTMTSTDFSKSFTQNFQDKGCAPWDTYCQSMMDKGDFDFEDEGDMFGQDWENAGCLSEKDAKRQKGEIKRDIQNLEQQLSVVDFSNASDLPAAVQAKSALDSIKSMNFEDSCEIGKAREILNTFQGDGGIQEAVNSANEIGNFRRELERIISEISQERKYRTSEKALAYLDKAEDAVEALRDNPPYNPDEPWKLWESFDPSCRRGGMGGFMPMNNGGFGGDMGGGSKGGSGFEFDPSSLGISSFSFGGSPFGGTSGGTGMNSVSGSGSPQFGPPMGGFQDPCSLEGLLKGGTPRGYLDAARRVDDEARQKKFEGNICDEAQNKIDQFEKMVESAAGKYAQEGRSIVAETNGFLGKCDGIKDKMKIVKVLEKSRKKAEVWMKKANIDTEEFEDDDGFSKGKMFQFGGVDQLMGDDLFSKIQSYIDSQVEKRLSEELPKLTQVFEERLSSIVAKLDQSIMDRITSIASSGSFEQITLDQLGGGVELASFVPEEFADTVNTQQDLTTELLQTSENIAQISEDAEKVVTELQEILTERTYPIAVLETVGEAVDQAETMANNGSDPSTVLEDAIQLIEGYSDADLNALQAAEGTWQFVDVDPETTKARDWYIPNVAEAFERGVATGTAVTVEVAGAEIEARKFEPGKTLNVAEGLTMITKSAGLEPVSSGDVSSEVDRLAGGSEWAAPYLQALANEIGIDEVRGSFESAGGAPSDPMDRANFAHVAVALYEDMGGTAAVDPESAIGHYQDFGQMDSTEKYDFAVAYDMGMITGANGGTLANFEATANRAEAAKMLSVFNEFAEHVEIFGASVAIGTPEGNTTAKPEEFVPEI
jgi:hypothetical protein